MISCTVTDEPDPRRRWSSPVSVAAFDPFAHDYCAFRNKYTEDIRHYVRDSTIGKDYEVFEKLVALELEHIVWADLPPNFEERFQIPHRRDYGVDSVNLSFTQSAQAKLYQSVNSSIDWTHFSTFFAYSSLGLGISDMVLATTPTAKVVAMAKMACHKANIPIRRYDFASLLKKHGGDTSRQMVTTPPTASVPLLPDRRDYQSDACRVIREADAAGARVPIRLQLPCGTGKTYIMLFAMLDRLRQDSASTFAILCPRTDLAWQTHRLMVTHFGEDRVAFVGDGHVPTDDAHAKVTVCMVHVADKFAASLIGRPPLSYLFVDEAHHAEDTDRTWHQTIATIPCTKRVDLSATFHDPDRVDFDYPMRQAIDEGHIADYCLHIEYFTSGDRMDALMRLLADNYLDWGPMFVYFNDVGRCHEAVGRMRKRGLACESLNGQDGRRKREDVRARVESGDLRVLALCGMFNEGISIDCLRTVVFGDLRHSDMNKIQIAMRANRLHPSKPFYRVVLPLTTDELACVDHDHARDLVRSFARVDPKVAEALQNRSATRIKLRVHQEEEGVDAPADADILYEEVYSSCADLLATDRLSLGEWKALLFAYCNAHDKVPSRREEYEGQRVGRWLSNQKNKIKSEADALYVELSANTLVKESIDQMLQARRNRISQKGLKALLFAYCDEYNKVPLSREEYEGQRVGRWLIDQKNKIKSEADALYVELSANAIVKESIDQTLRTRRECADKPTLTPNEWKALLFAYCDEYNKVPSFKEEYEGQRVGVWLNNQKTKIKSETDALYVELSANALIKESIDQMLRTRRECADKPTLTPNEWKALLFAYCDEYNKVPSFKEEYEGQRVGGWLNRQKTKIQSETDALYVELSANALVKESIDQTLRTRRECADKPTLTTPNEWKALLFAYCNEHDKVPSVREEYEGRRLGAWLNHQKTNIKSETDALYVELSVNTLVKESIDQTLRLRQKKRKRV